MTARRRPKPEASQTRPPVSAGETLGENLRAMFDHVATQPLPDEILDLVDELERKRSLEEPGED